MTTTGTKSPTYMKKTIISAFVLAFILSAVPLQTHAFDVLDPFGLFKADKPAQVINSNNTNSNVNSPGSTVTSTTNTTNNHPTTPTTVVTNPSIVYVPSPYQYQYDYSYNNSYNNNYNTSTGQLYANCYASPTYGQVGDQIAWVVNASGGNGSYSYTWSGTDGLSGSSRTLYRSYSYAGIKSASVYVTSGGQIASISCNNTATIDGYNSNNNYNYNYNNGYGYDYNNYNNSYYNNNYVTDMSVTCTPSTSFAQVGENMQWNISVSGGTGNYTYTWTGTDGLRSFDRNASVIYNSPGQKTASVTVYSGGRTQSQSCGYITVGIRNGGYYGNNTSGNLAATCYVDRTSVTPNSPVTWKAVATGGNGYYTYAWNGSEGLYGTQDTVTTGYAVSGTKTAGVTVTSNGQSIAASCANSTYISTATARRATTPTVAKATPASNVDASQGAAAFFSLNNVPWGAVAIIVIFVLFGTVMYLLFNKSKI